MRSNRTLVIAAHQDDETFSTGGLIADRTDTIDHCVRVLTIFGRQYNYGEGDQYEHEQQVDFNNAMLALRVTNGCSLGFPEGEPQRLGYYAALKVVERELMLFSPTEVIIPAGTDLNQDHRWLNDCCRVALRPANLGSVRRVLMSHGMDGGVPAGVNHFEVLGTDTLDRKLKAMTCYRRESRPTPHPRSREKMISYHRVVGGMCGVEYAEPYTVLLQIG